MLRTRPNVSISPLALLTLAACGGGAAESSGGGVGPTPTFSQSKVLNFEDGPLHKVLAFLDYNNNGTLDAGEPSGRTNVSGGITLTATQATYTAVGITDDSTTDASTGAILSGVTLKAPSNSTMVTPTTTLMEESNLTADQVAEVLGLPDGIDPLTFSAFSSGVNAADALAVEKANQQLMNVVTAFAAAAKGSGANVDDSFKAALKAVAEVVKTKAAKLTDVSASTADKKLDFTNTDDLTLIQGQVIKEVAKNTAVDTGAFGRVATNTITAIENVNVKIGKASDLSSDASKNIFSTSQALAFQVKTASEAEATVSGSGSNTITFIDSEKVDAATTNTAPTDISLSKSSISEGATSLIVGALSTTDDQVGGVFTYALAEVEGTDYAAFTLNQTTGEISLKVNPDYEVKKVYSLTILSTDSGGKTFSKSFDISVTKEPALSVSKSVTDDTTKVSLYVSQNAPDAGDGLGSLQFDLDYEADIVSFNATTLTFATGFTGILGAHDASTGLLTISGYAYPDYENFATPILEFDLVAVTALSDTSLSFSNLLIDDVDYDDQTIVLDIV